MANRHVIALVGGWEEYSIGTVERFEASEECPVAQVWIDLERRGRVEAKTMRAGRRKSSPLLGPTGRIAPEIASNPRDRIEAIMAQRWPVALGGYR